MRRSKYRRPSSSPAWFSGRRRVVVIGAAALAAFGGVVTVTQISSASTERTQQRALAACDDLEAPNRAQLSTQTRKGTYTTNNGRVTQHADDGAGDVATTAQVRARCRDWVVKNVSDETEATTQARRGGGRGNGGNNGGGNNNGGGQNNGGNQGGNGGEASAEPTDAASEPAEDGQNGGGENNGGNNGGGENNGGEQGGDQGNNGGDQGGDNGNNGGDNGNNGGDQGDNGGDQGGEEPAPAPTTPPPGAGLGVLTNSCETSNLEAHDGFQRGERCVSTEFGEVAAAANNSTLLITNAPRNVNRNQPFTIQVSTRNLIRDRFLAAGQGGYYVESSVLQNGLVRGHFHTACRILQNGNQAPAPEPVPEFFVATEDSRGGAQPDTVAIQVPGLPNSGNYQCSSWAGDGSHRVPMMERANQTPAFDSVRVRVR